VGRPLKIAMIGQKHYGSREGGVEVVVTELARRMAALGHEVTCYDRSGSDVMTGGAADACERVVDGVRVVPVRTIDKKGLAALSSSFFATLAAIKDGWPPPASAPSRPCSTRRTRSSSPAGSSTPATCFSTCSATAQRSRWYHLPAWLSSASCP